MALTKKLHAHFSYLFSKIEGNINKQNLFIQIPQMGNIIFGPFDETNTNYLLEFLNSAHMLCLLAPHLFICPVECPSYNLLCWEVCLLYRHLSQSDGLDLSQVIGGVVEGSFRKRFLTILFKKPTTKICMCKMEIDGWF